MDANALVQGSTGVWTAIRRAFKLATQSAAHRSLYFLAALSPQQPWPSRAVSEIEITLGFRKWRRHRESLAVAMFVLIVVGEKSPFHQLLGRFPILKILLIARKNASALAWRWSGSPNREI